MQHSYACCQKIGNENKVLLLFSCVVLTQGSPPLLKLDFGLWVRVTPRFFPILSPRSLFPTSQRFPMPKHVTSSSLSPPSLFYYWSAVFPILSPRSLFPTSQRFPMPKHVTSGSLSPPSLFTTGQRFPSQNTWSPHFQSLPVMWLPVPVVTSLFCSRPIRSQEIWQMGPHYYFWGTHKTVFGSFWDKIALNWQLLRLKDYYYWNLPGQENRQFHKEMDRTVKIESKACAVVLQLCLDLLLWINKHKIMDREIIFEKTLFENP